MLLYFLPTSFLVYSFLPAIPRPSFAPGVYPDPVGASRMVLRDRAQAGGVETNPRGRAGGAAPFGFKGAGVVSSSKLLLPLSLLGVS